MKVRNVRGDALEIAATGQVVEAGAEVEVDDDLGRALIEQPRNWVAVGAPAKAVKAKGDEV